MPLCRFLLLLAAGLLLGGLPAAAQTKTPASSPAPAPPPQKMLNVQITLPTLVGRVGEMTGILVTRDKQKSARSTRNPVVYLSIPLPRLFSADTPKDSGK
ncbi:hypothetical protein KLP40_12470 [Hymenobacter sp. NST-14]|uniref:hypothetical protein n=1 Tax=Hymenobacter piscis TaxID=2839984 RepID=UPI001C009CF1|nr:hypothetical protein [Hymenobacter piscis]MBT9393978.1 hypothetical protein [Hymenobacter piscis]